MRIERAPKSAPFLNDLIFKLNQNLVYILFSPSAHAFTLQSLSEDHVLPPPPAPPVLTGLGGLLPPPPPPPKLTVRFFFFTSC